MFLLTTLEAIMTPVEPATAKGPSEQCTPVLEIHKISLVPKPFGARSAP